MSQTNRSKCDPCGIVCLFFIYLIIIYTDYAFLRWIVLMSEPGFCSSLNVIVYQLILLLLAWSHLKAVTSDPGIVPAPKHGVDLSSEPLMSQQMMNNKHCWTVCGKCQMFRPPRAHHCRICKRCVRKMDHHCPWINNCVGEFNQKYFIQFLCYVFLASLYTAICILLTFIRIKHDDPNRIIHTIVLLIESLLFGLFSVAVLTDQLSAVFNGETAVERVKSQRNVTSKSKKLLLREVCGNGPFYLWIFPCSHLDKVHNKMNAHFVV